VSSVAARLELLCELNRRLATFGSLDELLTHATSRTRELFDAEGCALLLVDHATREFRFPVSSQRATNQAARLSEIRFPIQQGVAGWVFANGQAVAIDDAQHDPRFYKGVDRDTGTTTRSLLAAPLRTSEGAIGVIEVINPAGVGDGDLAFLEALGGNIAIAHERAAYTASLREEALGLRRLARFGAMAMVAFGLAVALTVAFARAARALPMREVVTEPGLLIGMLIAAAGLVLMSAVRRVPRAT
jgi:sigma-B regulation protein RsbU (phosphoserine phosphatase)